MTLAPYGASPMQTAAAYATHNNHGNKVTPSIVKSAWYKDRTFNKQDPIGEQALSRDMADAITKVLTGVVNDGTALGLGTRRAQPRGSAGRRQDRHFRRQRIGLVRRLHPEPGHRRRTVGRGRR
jgi:membrane peptidoglycan carboxypeptidase